MFPDEHHQAIVKRLDEVEMEAFALYRTVARLRLQLQNQWRVLPSNEPWTSARQEQAEEAVR